MQNKNSAEPHSSMSSAMEARGLDKSVIEWVMTMLKDRTISADLGGAQISIKSTKGCPQGGVLSPLLWSLVVDELVRNLIDQGFEVIEYADDVAILVRGKFDNTISDRLQTALNITLKWCRKEGLNVNPSKTIIVPFIRRKKVKLTRIEKSNLSYCQNYKLLATENGNISQTGVILLNNT